MFYYGSLVSQILITGNLGRKHCTMMSPLARCFVVLFFCQYVGVHAFKENSCEGYGHEEHDTCPTGKFCTESSSGICEDCTYCRLTQIQAHLVINKCYCQGGDSFRLCKHKDSDDQEDILIRNRTDLVAPWMVQLFDSVVGDSSNPYVVCPASPSTSQVIPPAVGTASTKEDSTTVGSTTASVTSSHGDENTSTENKDDKLCKDLTPPTNGFFQHYNNSVGGTAVVRCEDGYTMNGTSEVSCKEDGWVRDIPRCYPKAKELQDKGFPTVLSIIIIIAVVLLFTILVLILWTCRKKISFSNEQGPLRCEGAENPPQYEAAQGVDPLLCEGAQGGLLINVESDTCSSENETGTPDSSSSTAVELEELPHSSTQATFVESEDSANSIVTEDDQCTCRITTVSWNILAAALPSLLANQTLKEEFVKEIFQNADKTTEYTKTLGNICLMKDSRQFCDALRDGLHTFDINYVKNMEATLRCIENERDAHSKETIDKLLQKLRESHQCSQCQDVIAV